METLREIIPTDVQFSYWIGTPKPSTADGSPAPEIHMTFTGEAKWINRLWHDFYFSPCGVGIVSNPKPDSGNYTITLYSRCELGFIHTVYTILKSVFLTPIVHDEFADSVQKLLPKVATLNRCDVGDSAYLDRKVRMSFIGSRVWGRSFHNVLEIVRASMGPYTIDIRSTAETEDGPTDTLLVNSIDDDSWCCLDLTMCYTEKDVELFKGSIACMTHSNY